MSLLLTTCCGHGISQELEGWFQGIAHNITVFSKIYLSYLIDEVAEPWDSGILGSSAFLQHKVKIILYKKIWGKSANFYDIKSIAFSAFLKSLRLTS